MRDVIIDDNVSGRDFRTAYVANSPHHMTEAFGETTNRHSTLMQNNTAIDS